MQSRWRTALAVGSLVLSSIPASAQITLVGSGQISGTATDLSGITGLIADTATPPDPSSPAPHNRLGAFGSGITYSGHDDIFVAVNDRGFFSGATSVDYLDRFQIFRLVLDPVAHTVTPALLDTRLFVNELGQNFVGRAGAFNVVNPLATLRFDPEGVRLGPNGNMYVSDEYGPYIFEFNRQGHLIRRILIPSRFLIDNPNADGTLELPPGNTTGRQSNRGMEGLAISPDGRTLFGLMQNALIQDHALNASNSRRGVHNRLLKIDIATNATQEFVYQLSNRSNGTNEILAINDHQFLVIERDGNAGTAAAVKKIVKIDITGATDVSDVERLPETAAELPATGIVPVSKSDFLDLLHPSFGLAGASFPEKIEGLAWGPDLDNGDHVLYVLNDNDLFPQNPNYFWAFRIPAGMVPGFEAQTIHAPFFAPGQAKKN